MEHNRIKELREDRDIKQREIAAYRKGSAEHIQQL